MNRTNLHINLPKAKHFLSHAKHGVLDAKFQAFTNSNSALLTMLPKAWPLSLSTSVLLNSLPQPSLWTDLGEVSCVAMRAVLSVG